jgi:hypothetical protein
MKGAAVRESLPHGYGILRIGERRGQGACIGARQYASRCRGLDFRGAYIGGEECWCGVLGNPFVLAAAGCEALRAGGRIVLMMIPEGLLT